MLVYKFLLKFNAIILSAALSLSLSAQQDFLEFGNAWIRQMPPGSPTLAAYMSITNPGESAVKITGVWSSVSKSAELHSVNMDNEVMKMQHMTELLIAPGQTVELKQGSMHLMLMNVLKTLHEGDEVEIKFDLDGLPAASLTVPVKKEI